MVETYFVDWDSSYPCILRGEYDTYRRDLVLAKPCTSVRRPGD